VIRNLPALLFLLVVFVGLVALATVVVKAIWKR